MKTQRHTRRWTAAVVAAVGAVGMVACDGLLSTEELLPPEACGGALAQVTLHSGESTSVTACFSDPNQGALTYTVSSSDAEVVRATLSGALVTIEALRPGDATVTVTARDPQGLEGQQSFPVVVPNRAPLAVAELADQILELGRTGEVDLAGAFTEPDGEALSYAVATDDAEVAAVSLDGSMVAFAAVAKGAATVTVTATDPGGLAATQTVLVTVPNSPPVVVGTLADRTVEAETSETVDVGTGVFDDADGDALEYSAATSDPAVVQVAVSGSAVTLTLVRKGTATVTITATDEDGQSAATSFEVTAPNRGPLAVGVLADRTVEAETSEAVDVGSGVFNDPDGDALTYAAVSDNTEVVTVAVSGSEITLTLLAKGTATVTITATDTEGQFATTSFVVTVPNRTPVAVTTLADRTLKVEASATVEVGSGVFNDPDGDALTYAAASDNTEVVTVSVTDGNVALAAVGEGSAVVTVTATDTDGASITQAFAVTVTRFNRPPLAVGTISWPSMNGGDRETLAVSEYFTDPDGDELTYAAASSDAGVAEVTVSGSVAAVAARQEGRADVTITATDPEGLSVEQRFDVTVTGGDDPNNGNNGPKLRGSIPSQTLEDGRSRSVSMQAYFDDPDDDVLMYSATSSNPRAVVAYAANDRLVVGPVAGGEATVTVTAQDPWGAQASHSFRAVALNQPPMTTGRRLQDICTTNTSAGVSTHDLSNYFTDGDGGTRGGTLTYGATSSDDSVAVVSVSGSTLTVTPGNPWEERVFIRRIDGKDYYETLYHSMAAVDVSASDGTETASQHFRVFVARESRGNRSDQFKDQCMRPGPPLDRQDPGGARPGHVTFEASSVFGSHDGHRYYLNQRNSNAAGFAISETGTVRLRGRTPGNTARMTLTRCKDGNCSAKTFNVATIRGFRPSSNDMPDQGLARGSSTTVDLTRYFTPGDDVFPLTYSAASSNTSVATASLSGSTLTVTAASSAFGRATVTVTGTDAGQNYTVEEKFEVVVQSPDRQALKDLYNSTMGDQWHKSTNWMDDTKLISEWFGITTSSAGRVRRIHLQSNNLQGTLPSSLGNLTGIQYVLVNANELTGTVPDALVQILRQTYTFGSETRNGVLWIDGNAGLCTSVDSNAPRLRGRRPFRTHNFLGLEATMANVRDEKCSP